MCDSSISLNRISFSYYNHNVFSDFSLQIEYNTISFIIGNNGCGKTTLLKLICGLIQPNKGEILIHNKRIDTMTVNKKARMISYVPQTIYMNSDFLVKDYLALGRSPYLHWGHTLSKDDYQKIEETAEILGILPLIDKVFDELSGGQKQIVAVARAIVQNTPIIVMDEPMSALDIRKQTELLLLLVKLQKEGKTIILTTHNPNHTLQFDCKVGLLNSGKLIGYGNADNILTNENINIIFGDYVQMISHQNQKNIQFNMRR